MKKIKYVIFSSIIILLFGGGCTSNHLHLPDKIINKINHNSYIHFSIDDTLDVFKDITNNKYESIFENKTFKMCKNLHDRYGAVFSFYCFADLNNFKIKETTDCFSDEFMANSDWLKFGFHALNGESYLNLHDIEEKRDYDYVVSELIRITGSLDCIDNFVRLDRYVADEGSVKQLNETENGIVGLLAADDPDRQSYALNIEQMSKMYENDWLEYDSIVYTPTDIRLENIKNDNQFYEALDSVCDQKNIIIFTHEWILEETKVKEYMEKFAQFAFEYNVKFDFPENKVK